MILTRKEIQEEMELHNSDEVGIDNQWTMEDAEYHLLLSDKYHNQDVALYAYDIIHNSIGVIIDTSKDCCGTWLRLDSDGVVDSDDVLFLHTVDDVKRCITQTGADITPSTKKIIGIK